MTFAEIVEYESAHPGTKFRRVDYMTTWYLRFDPEHAGMLVQHSDDGATKPIELYHHDFKNGLWRVME